MTRTPPDPLLHLTLTWTARNLLTMTDDWRNRRVLLSGRRVSDETEMAANTLYAQGLIYIVSGMVLVPPGAIRVTEKGSARLTEWDMQAAGAHEVAVEPVDCADDRNRR